MKKFNRAGLATTAFALTLSLCQSLAFAQETSPAQNPMDTAVSSLLSGLSNIHGTMLRNSRSALISNALSLDGVAVCTANARNREFRELTQIGSRNGDHACQSGDAEKIRGPLAPGKCAIIAIQAVDSSADVDLSVADISSSGVSDVETSSFAITIDCNPSTNTEAVTPYIASRNYNSDAPMALAIVRIDVDQSAIVIPRQTASTVDYSDDEDSSAQSSGPRQRLAITEEQRTQVSAGLERFLSASTHPILMNANLASDYNAANLPFCVAAMPADSDTALTAEQVTARGGVHACSPAQAQNIVAPVAPGKCAIIGIKGFSTDIDMSLQLAGSVAIDDTAFDNSPSLMVCNETVAPAAPAPKNLSIFINSLQSTEDSVLITRIDFDAGNNHGRLPVEVLAQRASAAAVPQLRELLGRIKTVARITSQDVMEMQNFLTGYNIDVASTTQPMCLANFTLNPRDQENGGYVRITQATARTGENACSADQARAIFSPIPHGKCVALIASAINSGTDIDLAMVVASASSSAPSRYQDEAVQTPPFVYYCNTERRGSKNIEIWGTNNIGSGTIVTPSLITRYEFDVPSAR